MYSKFYFYFPYYKNIMNGNIDIRGKSGYLLKNDNNILGIQALAKNINDITEILIIPIQIITRNKRGMIIICLMV